MRGDDRLQHELHHQFAESFLVQPTDANRAHRATIPCQRLRRRTAFRRHKIANGLARETRLARKLCEIAVDTRPLSFSLDRDDRELLVTGPADEQLQLAMLVDRSERR